MTGDAAQEVSTLLDCSWRALRLGDRLSARRYAEQALALDPDREEPWLILAAVASPHASVMYLTRALEINPQSQAARQGMQWASERLLASQAGPVLPPRRVPVEAIASQAIIRPKQMTTAYLLVFLVILAGFALWYGYPKISLAGFQQITPTTAPVIVFVDYTPTSPPLPEITAQPSATPLPVISVAATEIPAQTPVGEMTSFVFVTEPSPPDSPQLLDTPAPTETPVESAGEQPKKKKKNPKNKASQQNTSPKEIASGGHWIDVDLSDQRTYAYNNDELIRSFVVSTGTWQHPTVTGTYRIYVKYQAADMSGPDYYLQDVPYVMYFYKGYGIHGTYWHNNFGTPMSHGCVNLSIADASWLYDFASVGTIVYVHQ